ncbi:MAG: hypothetical protein HQL32_12975, partial [Planctomycetes bacterium]|nr:hypothetical protein [Planctomycetota bacterium]
LGKIIEALASSYAKGPDASLQALASESDASALQSYLLAQLTDQFKGGIEIKPVPGIEAGLKVSFSGDSLMHDFTSEAVSELLCAYLRPRVLDALKTEG